MTELFQAAHFVNRAWRRMRYGALSRAPLRLLRLEWKGPLVECDWLMRAPDPWDRDLPRDVAEELHSQQALRDALALRDIVFDAFPRVDKAELRMYRQASEETFELMMSGRLHRSNGVLARVPSLVMRAKLCGFDFSLAQGILETRGRVSWV